MLLFPPSKAALGKPLYGDDCANCHRHSVPAATRIAGLALFGCNHPTRHMIFPCFAASLVEYLHQTPKEAAHNPFRERKHPCHFQPCRLLKLMPF